MISRTFLIKKSNYLLHPFNSLLTGNKTPFSSYQHGHHAKAGTTGSNDIARSSTFARHSGIFMPKVPEVLEGLLLYQCQQVLIRNTLKLISIIHSCLNHTNLAIGKQCPGSGFHPRIDNQFIR